MVDVQFWPVLSTSSGSSTVLDELLGCSHRSILSGRFIWFSFGRTGCTDKSLGSSFLILGGESLWVVSARVGGRGGIFCEGCWAGEGVSAAATRVRA
ncbi:hypothetical protein FH972_016770 [Carpinus fangiana]|uniref:Uncharacterized protein n=1 Tax=Carpinus fangiana TaxID=176857 RepID=A0A5N6RHE0_9ROSI|nr:hypothetical protein FH972_016770 [Carpinus fangiana]